MDNFNFDELAQVRRSIDRNTGSSPFSRTAPNKDGNITFKFNQATFNELGLDANSLETFTSKDKKSVFLAVVPGNTGDFMKSREGSKKKGPQAYHNDLSKAIDAAGITGNAFTLNKVGENSGKVYYQIVAGPAEEASSAAPKKARKTAKTAETAQV